MHLKLFCLDFEIFLDHIILVCIHYCFCFYIVGNEIIKDILFLV